MLYRGQAAIDHPKQGMVPDHMKAFAAVAQKRNELIMVRPVSPWAKKMIEDGCPTKGFAVKAKSSNWGPQCGLIPADPAYPFLSKVGKGPKQQDNVKFIKYGLAHPEPTTHLQISGARIDELKQINDPETGNFPIIRDVRSGEHGDRLLTSICPESKGEEFHFLAKHISGSGASAQYLIYLRIIETFNVSGIDFKEYFHPVYVFSGPTPDGGQKPLVADYDLLTVSPRWKDFDPKQDSPIIPIGIKNAFKQAQKLHKSEMTLKLTPYEPSTDPLAAGIEVRKYEESHDYGNWSVRVRNAVRSLNEKMGYVDTRDCLRTVHHSADLISPFPQVIVDDLPATIFLPSRQNEINFTIILIDDRETLEQFLQKAGQIFYIPRNSAHKGSEAGGLSNLWGSEGFNKREMLEEHFRKRLGGEDTEARNMQRRSESQYRKAQIRTNALRFAKAIEELVKVLNTANID